jgi:hypothetical protein
MERPGIAVRSNQIKLFSGGGTHEKVVVENQIPSNWPGKALLSSTLGYKMRRTVVTFDNKVPSLSAVQRSEDKPTHALVLVNPVANLITWSKVEIEVSPECTILQSVRDFRGQVCEMLVLAPINAEIQWTVHSFPVEATVAPGLGTPIYVPVEDIVTHSRLKVEEDGQVRLIFTGKA